MSNRATMPLMMACRMEPMPLTMAMRQLPIVRSTDWICCVVSTAIALVRNAAGAVEGAYAGYYGTHCGGSVMRRFEM